MEEQIAYALRQADTGTAVKPECAERWGVSEQTLWFLKPYPRDRD